MDRFDSNEAAPKSRTQKPALKAQGGVARDATRSIQDLRDAIGRHVDLSREFSRAHIECFEFFSQVLPGWIAVSAIATLLVIVDNLHVRWPRCSVRPLEANSPLIVNADAVLALAVTYQRFKTVSRQRREITHRGSRLHTVKLQASGPLKAREALTRLPAANSLVLLSR